MENSKKSLQVWESKLQNEIDRRYGGNHKVELKSHPQTEDAFVIFIDGEECTVEWSENAKLKSETFFGENLEDEIVQILVDNLKTYLK